MSRTLFLTVATIAGALFLSANPARAADANAPVDYPRDWGPDLCLGENGTRVVDTSSSATSPDALVDGIAGEGHQWEPSWSNGLPASFTLRLPRVERWNKLVFTTRTSGEGYPRECELWAGRTQADLHLERTLSFAKKNQQIADFEPVEGQFLRIVIKSTWRDDEVELGEVAIFFHAASPPHAVEGKDAVEVKGGDKLLGDVQGESWSFKGRLFELKVARADLVGAALSDEGDRVYLASGEVLQGELGLDKLAFRLESGQTLELPRAKVVSIAARARAGEFPSKAEDMAPRGSVLVLESGERWLAKATAPRLELETTLGRLSLSLEAVTQVAFSQGSETLDKVSLKGGDVLHGFVLGDALSFKLGLGPEVQVPRALLQRFVVQPEEDNEAGAPENQRVALKTGDVVSGSLLVDKIPLRTSYATVDVVVGSLDRLEALDGGRVKVALRDGSVLVGRPGVEALPFELDAGGKVQLPIDRVRKVENWRLPAETLARVDALVKKLDDPSWPKRDAAKTELAKLGKLALPRLTRLLHTGTPEEKKSATDILNLIKSEESAGK